MNSPNVPSRSHNSNPRAILASLMGSWAFGRLLNVLADDAIVWQVGAFVDALTIALAVTLAAQMIPYDRLRAKSLAFALAAVAWLEFVYLAIHLTAGLSFYNYWLLIEAGTFLTVAFCYATRPYRLPSDTLDDEHIFLVCRRPHTPQGFYLSLLGLFGPFGGFSLYARGSLYGFRRGTLRATPVTPDYFSSDFHIRRGQPITNNNLAELTAMIGRQWSLRDNCLGLRKHAGTDNGISKGIARRQGVGAHSGTCGWLHGGEE